MTKRKAKMSKKNCGNCGNKDKQCINFPCKNKSNWQPIKEESKSCNTCWKDDDGYCELGKENYSECQAKNLIYWQSRHPIPEKEKKSCGNCARKGEKERKTMGDIGTHGYDIISDNGCCFVKKTCDNCGKRKDCRLDCYANCYCGLWQPIPEKEKVEEKSCGLCANKDKQCVNFPCKNKSNWQPIKGEQSAE